MIARTAALSLLLGAAGVVLAFWWFGEDVRQLASVPVASLLLAAALVFVNYLGGGLRLMLLCRRLNHRISFAYAVRAYLIGMFGAAATPGGSGQAPALVWMLGEAGIPAAQAAAVAVYVSALDLFFFAWAVPLALLALGGALFGTGDAAWSAQLGLVALALGAGLLFFALAWGLVRHLDRLWRPLLRLLSLPFLRRWRRRSARAFDQVEQTTGGFVDAPLAWQLAMQLLSAATFGATLLVFPAVASGLDAGLHLGAAVASALLASILGFIAPTPGGAGVVELGAASLASAQGASAAVTAAALWRLLVHYTRFPLGLAFGGPAALRAATRLRARREANGADGDR